MAVTCAPVLTLTYSGDVVGVETLTPAVNVASPGQIQLVALAVGANTITVPLAGAVPTGVVIYPPAGNTNVLTLKGVAGDGGISIHLTNPTYLGLNASVTTFVINCATAITNIRLFWI